MANVGGWCGQRSFTVFVLRTAIGKGLQRMENLAGRLWNAMRVEKEMVLFEVSMCSVKSALAAINSMVTYGDLARKINSERTLERKPVTKSA